jgi:HEAT repeat protein
MEFDLQNFGIGLITGWATAYAIYRARGLFQAASQTVSETATSVGNSAMRTADSRYVSDLVAQCETSHLAGAQIKLSELIVEPRFIPPPEFARPIEADEFRDVFELVPQVHDYPAIYSHYNIDTLSINELAAGSHALALLGEPGSGRTTALMALALQSLGKIRFHQPLDSVKERMDKEDLQLSEKERGVRVKERILMEQRAKEQLALERGLKYDAHAEEEVKAKLPLFNRLMPIYVHLADIRLGSEYGSQIDPAEPIVRAVQHTVKRVTASTIPRHIYRRLNDGQALLLIDGFDDLPESERPAILAWLSAFMKEYSSNFIIVAGPALGYGGLIKLGLTPIFLRPWSQPDTDGYIDRFSRSWTSIGRKRRGVKSLEKDMIDRSRVGTRGLTPFQLTLKLWTTYADDSEMPGFEGWIRAFLKRSLPDTKSPDNAIQSMALMAALQLDEGFITTGRLQALKIAEDSDLAPPVPGSEAAAAAEMQPDAQPEAEQKGRRGKKKDGEEVETTVQGRLLAALRQVGLLMGYRGDRYQFHPTLAAYLASLTLKSPEAVAAKLDAPAWRDAVAYANLHVPTESIVRSRLDSTGDLLQTHITEMARWMPYAPTDAPWRGDLLKMLGAFLSAPNQYPLMRERAVAALAATRDQRSATFVLRRAVRSTDAEIRRLACIGLGALGDPEVIKDLRALVRDQVEDVGTAATLALGAVGTAETVEILESVLLDGTERQRQAVAETLALMPEHGYPLLHDAINSNEMILRRAGAMGLRRLRTTWALIFIYRAYLEDDQWYVRSAAQQAFEENQYGRAIVPTQAYPKPDSIEWLKNWVSSKGEKLPQGDLAVGMLTRALSEGDAGTRALAAMNLAQLGITASVKNLYTALRDRQDDVRITAYRALALMQLQVGRALPSAI